MAFPTCGTSLRTWSPYTPELLRGLLSQVRPQPADVACTDQCGLPNVKPPSFDVLAQCASCTLGREVVRKQYGCAWCTSVLAPLRHSLGRLPSVAEVQGYLDGSGEVFVKASALWEGLTECERGAAASLVCFQDGDSGLPYASDTQSSGSGSWWSRPGFVVLWVVLGLFVVVGLVYVYRVRFNQRKRDRAEQDLHERRQNSQRQNEFEAQQSDSSGKSNGDDENGSASDGDNATRVSFQRARPFAARKRKNRRVRFQNQPHLNSELLVAGEPIPLGTGTSNSEGNVDAASQVLALQNDDEVMVVDPEEILQMSQEGLDEYFRSRFPDVQRLQEMKQLLDADPNPDSEAIQAYNIEHAKAERQNRAIEYANVILQRARESRSNV